MELDRELFHRFLVRLIPLVIILAIAVYFITRI